MGLNMLPNNPDRSHAHNYVINTLIRAMVFRTFISPLYFVAHVRRGTCIYTLNFSNPITLYTLD